MHTLTCCVATAQRDAQSTSVQVTLRRTPLSAPLLMCLLWNSILTAMPQKSLPTAKSCLSPYLNCSMNTISSLSAEP